MCTRGLVHCYYYKFVCAKRRARSVKYISPPHTLLYRIILHQFKYVHLMPRHVRFNRRCGGPPNRRTYKILLYYIIWCSNENERILPVKKHAPKQCESEERKKRCVRVRAYRNGQIGHVHRRRRSLLFVPTQLIILINIRK